MQSNHDLGTSPQNPPSPRPSSLRSHPRAAPVETIQFTNGATLKFMSGGGGDKSRAGFTSRVVVIIETDGMDEAGISSRETLAEGLLLAT